MYQYKTNVKWIEEKKILLHIDSSKPEVEVATPPEFGGHEGYISPEDLFVASAVTCFSVTFLGIAKNSKVEIEEFECDAVGYLNKIDGKLIFTEIRLKPKVLSKAEKSLLERILRKAEETCLVTNSMKSKVVLEI